MLLAAAAGLPVASLYFSQGLLGVLADDIGASGSTIGLVPTLLQLGYAAGILLLAPLGERFDRRRIIVLKATALTLALLPGALSPGIGMLLVASACIGFTATMAQDVVPAAATLAPDRHRGKVVGTVMTGLLMGMLLSRAVGGFAAEHHGWHAMFYMAAASIALIGVACWRKLPRFLPTARMSYLSLLASLLKLWRQYGDLRRATLAQGFLSLGFSAFWSTLSVMLHAAPFHLNGTSAGASGLAGAAGALAAPLAGRVSDKRGPELVTRLGATLTAAAFGAMLFSPLLAPFAQLALIAICAILFDLGAQISLVARQTITYDVDPGARSRLNAVLFVGCSPACRRGPLWEACCWPVRAGLACRPWRSVAHWPRSRR
ncbi:MFS transporter [Cupriavidus sp. 8B]